MAYKGPKLGKLTPAARAKRVASLAANPATRHAIPDQYLPAQYRAGRASAIAGKAEVAPGLTQGDLTKQLGAATDLQFGSQERNLQAQAPRLTDWYKQYVDAINQAGDKQRGVTAAAVGGVANLQSGLDTAAAQQWAGQQQAMGKDAAARGASTDATLADQAHNASNVRNALTGGFGAMLLGQGKNESDFLANRGLVAGQQGIEALGRNQGALTELGREKADFQTKFTADTTKAAQEAAWQAEDNKFKRWLQRQEAKNAGIRTGLAKSGQKFDQHKWNQTTNPTYNLSNGAVVELRKTAEGKAHLADLAAKVTRTLHPPKTPKTVKAPKPTSGPGSLTPAEEQKRLERVRKIAQYFQTGVTQTTTDASGKTITTRVANAGDVAAVKTWLRQQGVDPLAIGVGESLYHNGGSTLGPDGVSKAHKYGVHVGGNFKVTRGPGKRPT